MYLLIGTLPLLLATYVRAYHNDWLQGDTQYALPLLITSYASPWVQVLFFGALLSAIMSTASGAVLAPAAILAENILPRVLKTTAKRSLLLVSRLSVVGVGAVSYAFTFASQDIHEQVALSAGLGMVGLATPLLAGLYWKRMQRGAGVVSMLAGMAVYIMALLLDTTVSPMMWGFAGSIIGLLMGHVFIAQWNRLR